MQNTINHLIDHFILEDSEYSHRVHHIHARQQVTEPLHTSDEAFTKQAIQAVLEKFDPCKAPSEDTQNS